MEVTEIKRIVQWVLAGLLIISAVALFFYTSITWIIIATVIVACMLAVEVWDMYQNKQRSAWGILIFAVMAALLVAQIVQPNLFSY